MKYPLILILLFAVFAAGMPMAFAEEGGAVTAESGKETGKKNETKKDDSKKNEGKKDEDKKEEAKKPPADISGGRFAGDPVYVHLAPMILPIITDNGAEQIITLQITIQVKDFDAADTVHTNMPRVMDSLMRALYGNLGDGAVMNGQLINVSKVKARATTALGEAVGTDNIRDVLIEAVSQRRL